jgi:anti-anti-sigma factor
MAGEIEREESGSITILSVPARLDTLLGEVLRGICKELANEGRFRVVVDCEHLSFLNSIVIGILLSFHQQALERGGDLKFANVSVAVEDVFHLANLDKVFHWYSNVDEAIAAF